jgi:hypothetical protein
MRLSYIFICCALLSGIFVGCQLLQSSDNNAISTGTPHLVVQQPIHDFGTVAEGDEVGAVFWVTNSGDAPLIVTNVKAGCGCTSVKWPQVPVAPGDSGKVEVIFNTRARSGMQSKSVEVFSNAPESPFELLFTAFVQSK